MNSSPRPRFIALAIAGSTALPQFVLGGGISLYEIAMPDVGLAAAGYAARAQDASALYNNPARGLPIRRRLASDLRRRRFLQSWFSFFTLNMNWKF